MKKRLNITLEEDIYFGLHQRLGQRRISQFIENLIRLHVIQKDLEAAYREMAADDEREQAALEKGGQAFDYLIRNESSFLPLFYLIKVTVKN